MIKVRLILLATPQSRALIGNRVIINKTELQEGNRGIEVGVRLSIIIGFHCRKASVILSP
jgi:hypothetical protein